MGRGRVVVFVVVAELVVAAALLLSGRGGPDSDSIDGRWRVYPDAFATQGGSQDGPQVFLPAGECFVGFAVGLRAVYWSASGDCSHPAVVGPIGRPPGGGQPGEDFQHIIAAVPAHGGGYLVLARATFDVDRSTDHVVVIRGDPSSGWIHVAELHADGPRAGFIGPLAVVAVEGGYVAIGSHDDAPVAWRSADGSVWREVPLPTPAGLMAADVRALAADPEGRLVAVGFARTVAGSTRTVAWASTDGGARWRASLPPDIGASPHLWTVVHSGGRFVAFGGFDPDANSPALVLTSRNGLSWARDESAAAAGARLISAATALPDGGVLAVSATGRTGEPRSPLRPGDDCAAAWRWDGTQWTQESLGCHGVPTVVVALRDGRVAAAYLTTLFLRAP